MFSKILDGFFDVLKILLPDKTLSNTAWVTRIIILLFMGVTLFGLPFALLRDSPLGVHYGINSPEPLPVLSNREYRNIQAVIYSFLVRIKEENPSMRAAYFVTIFDKNGNISFASKDASSFGVFTWINPGQYFSFSGFEEVLKKTKKPYLEKLGIEKECVAATLSPIDIDRYKQAVLGFNSDRFVMCPAPNQRNKLPFGGVIAYYLFDPKQPQVENELMGSVKTASADISDYLISRRDLPLNEP